MSWRDLILPREHGVWGLLAGAALVGLPLGQDLAALPLLGSALVAVGLRQAVQARRGSPGRAGAIVGLGLLAGVALLATAALAGARPWLPWLAATVAIGMCCLRTPAGRPWWSSALGGVAAGGLTATMVVAGGGSPAWAAIAGAGLAAHIVASVPLVRAQSRRQERWARLAIGLHVAILLIAVGCWAAGLLPSGIALVFAIGLVRACWLVAKVASTPCSPARIGTRELAWLPVMATGVVLALRVGWH